MFVEKWLVKYILKIIEYKNAVYFKAYPFSFEVNITDCIETINNLALNYSLILIKLAAFFNIMNVFVLIGVTAEN